MFQTPMGEGQPFMTPTEWLWVVSQVGEAMKEQFGIELNDIVDYEVCEPDDFRTRLFLKKKITNIPIKFSRLLGTLEGQVAGWAFNYYENEENHQATILINYFTNADDYWEYKRKNITTGEHHGNGLCCSDCYGKKNRKQKNRTHPDNRNSSPQEKTERYERRLRVEKERRARRKGKK